MDKHKINNLTPSAIDSDLSRAAMHLNTITGVLLLYQSISADEDRTSVLEKQLMDLRGSALLILLSPSD